MNEEEKVDKRFGILIAKWRRDKGIEQVEAARQMGIEQYRLYELEKGQPNIGVTLNEVQLIARVYSVHPSHVRDAALGKVTGWIHAV